jgi:hypothetical protein
MESSSEAYCDLSDLVDQGGESQSVAPEALSQARLGELVASRSQGFVVGGPRLVADNRWIFYFVPPPGLKVELLLVHGDKEMQRLPLNDPVGIDVTWDDSAKKFVVASTRDAVPEPE